MALLLDDSGGRTAVAWNSSRSSCTFYTLQLQSWLLHLHFQAAGSMFAGKLESLIGGPLGSQGQGY